MRDEVKEIFIQAMDLPREQWPAFLDEHCANNPALRAEVDELLSAHTHAGEFLAGPTVLPESKAGASESSQPTAREIGPYKLIKIIGEGGFGTVYLAEQEQPVRRRVALKIIKLGMDTQQIIARFEAERQALAMMEHPNIARVIDAGATSTGRPYFVMELVEGVPVTQYCDDNRLTPRQRLELFIPICQAVQHAHQKGIIHRDLKPSNVLVSLQDGRPVPKVIDFGIAKATQSRLTEKTLFTEFRQMIGTPEYMSPEQADVSIIDIDTRSDVYSLGVLLYELLTGLTPFDSRELRSKAFGEIQRVIREVDPPRPSTRVSTSDALPSIAARRSLEPAKLSAEVRGELDWIVMKTLEKDRSRRYESASSLAADLMHYLANEPVSAGPVSASYRIRKFVRRHRGPVLASAAILLTLVGGIVGTTIGLIGQARQRAEAQRQAAEAKRQTEIADAVSQFQADMLSSADPQKLLGDKVTVLQAVTAAVKELDGGKLKDQPLVEASVRTMIGRTLQSLGRYDQAEPSFRKALDLRRAALPAGDPYIAASLGDLGILLRDENKLDEVEPLLNEAYEMRRKAVPTVPQDLAHATSDLAIFNYTRSKLPEAERLAREALEINRKALPAGNSEIAINLNNLAVILKAEGKFAEAEPLEREALQIERQTLPAGHPTIAKSIDNLGQTLLQESNLAGAEPLLREALEMRRKVYGPDHPQIAVGANNLAMVLYHEGRYAEAEPLSREALQICRKTMPPGHPDIASSLNGLTAVLQAEEKLSEAEPLSREALEITRKSLPANHPDIALSLNNLATLLHDQGKLTEAEQCYRECLDICRKAFPPSHPNIAQVSISLARALRDQKKYADAEPLYRESLAAYEHNLGKTSAEASVARVGLALDLTELNRYAEAESLFLEAEAPLAALPHPPPGRHEQAIRGLIDLYWRWDTAEPGKGYQAKAKRWEARIPASRPTTRSP